MPNVFKILRTTVIKIGLFFFLVTLFLVSPICVILRVRLDSFPRRFVPLLTPNPGDAIAHWERAASPANGNVMGENLTTHQPV